MGHGVNPIAAIGWLVQSGGVSAIRGYGSDCLVDAVAGPGGWPHGGALALRRSDRRTLITSPKWSASPVPLGTIRDITSQKSFHGLFGGFN